MAYPGDVTCRPPMERSSYMVHVTAGCSYHRCKFCNYFRGTAYHEASLTQIEEELKRVSDIGGKPTRIFLGDGNTFGVKTEKLLQILDLIHTYFPNCKSINMDATVTSILRKSDDELKALYEHGVRHLYIGIESGLDDVLIYMQKDHLTADAQKAAERLHAAGLCFDAHIIAGIAGAGRGQESAIATARFLSAAKPYHIVGAALRVDPGTGLYEDVKEGLFHPAEEVENLKEERTIVELLEIPEGHTIEYNSFHDVGQFRNSGTLPRDREKMIAKLDKAIALLEA